VDEWAYEHGVALDFIQPGKPIQNPFVESSNGKMRDECLNVHWFANVEEARSLVEEWRRDYTQVRPHSSLLDRAEQGNFGSARYAPFSPWAEASPSKLRLSSKGRLLPQHQLVR
jgi:transposase InsO family protein